MLEAYTTLGYLAARTSKVELLAWVTAVSYRDPGMLAKIVTTLDVLSNGPRLARHRRRLERARRPRASACSSRRTAERFERLEETLQICLQMWSDDDGPYDGKHYQLGRTLNVPQTLQRPHPPILIGGGGREEDAAAGRAVRRRLQPVPQPDLEHKLDVLREHCADVGRDYDDDREDGDVRPRPRRERREGRRPARRSCERLAGLGISEAHGWVPRV